MTVRSPDSLVDFVRSLQQVIEKAGASTTSPPVEVLRKEAVAAGFDPDLAEQVYLKVSNRLDRERHRPLIEKRISEEEIAEVVVGLLREGDLSRLAPWAKARAFIRDSGEQLGAVMEDLLAVAERTGFGLRPNLDDVGQELAAWLRAAGHADAGALTAAARQAVDTGKLAPWQGRLLAVWLQSERGRQGQLPGHDDLADLLVQSETARELAQAADGPWDTLMKQAAWVRAHRRVGDAFAELAAAS